MEVRIFQKGFNYAQDGPGNRLVYHLQGCNLRCPWCSNPEGLSAAGGTAYSPEALAEEARYSRPMFFDGGGVTLTGGEATLQFEGVKALLRLLHGQGDHTCMETNGMSPRLPELFPLLDLIIMDVKHYDPEKHRAVTGEACHAVYHNVAAALADGRRLALRIPLIGGFNASPEDAEGFARLFRSLGVPGRATVELLRYHEYGRSKYDALHLPYSMGGEARVSDGAFRRVWEILAGSGLTLVQT